MKARPGERRITARHEAGHAVAAAVFGISVEYLTLNPRDPRFAGQVRCRRPGRCTPNWEPYPIVAAAGMAAQAVTAASVIRNKKPRQLIVDAGRSDLRNLRAVCGAYWEAVQLGGSQAPAIDPAWTPLDMGAHIWRRAVDLVLEYDAAIRAVAEHALATNRKVSGTQIRRIVAEHPAGTRPLAVPAHHLEQVRAWWVPRHSRLKWEVPASRVAQYPRWRARREQEAAA